LSGTRRFGGTYRLHLQGRRIVQQTSEQAGGMPPSETSGTILRTTRRHIPEDDTLQNHRCENLKSYTTSLITSIEFCGFNGSTRAVIYRI
jgi:hypothetical protein